MTDDQQFDLISLLNLLALYGYELTRVEGNYIVVTRLSDGKVFRTRAFDYYTWKMQIKRWDMGDAGFTDNWADPPPYVLDY